MATQVISTKIFEIYKISLLIILFKNKLIIHYLLDALGYGKFIPNSKYTKENNRGSLTSKGLDTCNYSFKKKLTTRKKLLICLMNMPLLGTITIITL